MKFVALPLIGAVVTFGQMSLANSLVVEISDSDRQVKVEQLDSTTGQSKPLAHAYVKGHDGKLKLKLPSDYDGSGGDLRVLKTDAVSKLNRHLRGHELPQFGASEGNYRWDSGYAAWAGAPEAVTDVTLDAGVEAQPERSDIWTLDGNDLFFFNQYRGLQWIDLTDPDNPDLINVFRYPAAGEELYPIAGDRTLLIANDAIDLSVQLLSVAHAEGELTESASIDLPGGYYVDSRKLGDRVYLLTEQYYYQEDVSGSQGIRMFKLITVDVSAGALEVIDEKEIPRSMYNVPVLTISGGYLLFSHGSLLTAYSLNTDGIPEETLGLVLPGQVKDHFKMQVSGNRLTVITENPGPVTELSTYALDGDGTALDSVQLAPGETLFASRFDGDTAYLVTFLRKDPLFAIDLSDPSNLVELGKLDVPGWSTYLQFYDGFLFSVGIEDNRVAVSLFDVSDPSNMFLLDREYLGDTNSWSEANYDDRAISYFPGEGLAMVPYETWPSSGSGPEKAVQLLSVDGSGLEPLGTINHFDQPRRGNLVEDSVLTISGRDLLVTSVADRQNPTLSSELSLAWQVSTLYSVGDYLLQLEARNSDPYIYYAWNQLVSSGEAYSDSVYYYLAPKTQPNRAIASGKLSDGSYAGSYLDDGILQVITQEVQLDEESMLTTSTFSMEVWDVSNPSVFLKQSEVSMESDVVQKVQFNASPGPVEGQVVWSSDTYTQQYVMPWVDFAFIDVFWPGYYYGNSHPAFLLSEWDGSSVEILNMFSMESLTDGYYQGAIYEAPFWFVRQSQTIEVGDDPDRIEYRYEQSLRAFDLSNPLNPVDLGNILFDGNYLGLELDPVEPLVWIFSLSPKLEYNDDGQRIYAPSYQQQEQMNVFAWDYSQVFVMKRELLEASGGVQGRPFFDDFNYFQNRMQLGEPDDWSTASFSTHVWQFDPESVSLEKADSLSGLSANLVQNGILSDYYYELRDNVVRFYELLEEPAGLNLSLHAELSLNRNLVYNYSVADSLIEGDSLYLPAGLYGVDVFSLPGGQALAQTSPQIKQLASESQWTLVPQMDWELVDSNVADPVGSLQNLRWRVKPDNFQTFLPDAEDEGDYWYKSEWMGWYRQDPDHGKWITHLDHGFIYPLTASDASALYYDRDLGYLWTSNSHYPHLYDYQEGQWIYYYEGSGQAGLRWFYRFSGNDTGWFNP